MNSLYGTPLTGLQGAQFQLDVAANNIANLNTGGFQEVESQVESLPLQNAIAPPQTAAGTSRRSRGHGCTTGRHRAQSGAGAAGRHR